MKTHSSFLKICCWFVLAVTAVSAEEADSSHLSSNSSFNHHHPSGVPPQPPSSLLSLPETHTLHQIDVVGAEEGGDRRWSLPQQEGGSASASGELEGDVTLQPRSGVTYGQVDGTKQLVDFHSHQDAQVLLAQNSAASDAHVDSRQDIQDPMGQDIQDPMGQGTDLFSNQDTQVPTTQEAVLPSSQNKESPYIQDAGRISRGETSQPSLQDEDLAFKQEAADSHNQNTDRMLNQEAVNSNQNENILSNYDLGSISSGVSEEDYVSGRETDAGIKEQPHDASEERVHDAVQGTLTEKAGEEAAIRGTEEEREIREEAAVWGTESREAVIQGITEKALWGSSHIANTPSYYQFSLDMEGIHGSFGDKIEPLSQSLNSQVGAGMTAHSTGTFPVSFNTHSMTSHEEELLPFVESIASRLEERDSGLPTPTASDVEIQATRLTGNSFPDVVEMSEADLSTHIVTFSKFSDPENLQSSFADSFSRDGSNTADRMWSHTPTLEDIEFLRTSSIQMRETVSNQMGNMLTAVNGWIPRWPSELLTDTDYTIHSHDSFGERIHEFTDSLPSGYSEVNRRDSSTHSIASKVKSSDYNTLDVTNFPATANVHSEGDNVDISAVTGLITSTAVATDKVVTVSWNVDSKNSQLETLSISSFLSKSRDALETPHISVDIADSMQPDSIRTLQVRDSVSFNPVGDIHWLSDEDSPSSINVDAINLSHGLTEVETITPTRSSHINITAISERTTSNLTAVSEKTATEVTAVNASITPDLHTTESSVPGANITDSTITLVAATERGNSHSERADERNISGHFWPSGWGSYNTHPTPCTGNFSGNRISDDCGVSTDVKPWIASSQVMGINTEITGLRTGESDSDENMQNGTRQWETTESLATPGRDWGVIVPSVTEVEDTVVNNTESLPTNSESKPGDTGDSFEQTNISSDSSGASSITETSVEDSVAHVLSPDHSPSPSSSSVVPSDHSLLLQSSFSDSESAAQPTTDASVQTFNSEIASTFLDVPTALSSTGIVSSSQPLVVGSGKGSSYITITQAYFPIHASSSVTMNPFITESTLVNGSIKSSAEATNISEPLTGFSSISHITSKMTDMTISSSGTVDTTASTIRVGFLSDDDSSLETTKPKLNETLTHSETNVVHDKSGNMAAKKNLTAKPVTIIRIPNNFTSVPTQNATNIPPLHLEDVTFTISVNTTTAGNNISFSSNTWHIDGSTDSPITETDSRPRTVEAETGNSTYDTTLPQGAPNKGEKDMMTEHSNRELIYDTVVADTKDKIDNVSATENIPQRINPADGGIKSTIESTPQTTSLAESKINVSTTASTSNTTSVEGKVDNSSDSTPNPTSSLESHFNVSATKTTDRASVVGSKANAPTTESMPDTNTLMKVNGKLVPPVPVYILILLDFTWEEFCNNVRLFQEAMAIIVNLGEDENLLMGVTPEQIILFELPICAARLTKLRPKRNDVKETAILVHSITVHFYIENRDGVYDRDLTVMFSKAWSSCHLEDTIFHNKVRKMEIIYPSDSDGTVEHTSLPGNAGIIAAITLSGIAAVCLLLLGVLLAVMKRRQSRYTYGHRCTPVSLDDYSIDSISLNDSLRRKNRIGSKQSYLNKGFDDPNDLTHPVNVTSLASSGSNLESLREEFKLIPNHMPTIDDLPPGADVKNRYANVIPFPMTRVKLSCIPGEPNSDYINANFVQGRKEKVYEYVACQAPLESTVADMWRMIWERQCKVIIMLTDLVENGMQRCAEYFPPTEMLDCHRLYGDYQVTLKKQEIREKHIVSSMQLKNMETNLWREITHFWYMGWPSQGVPDEASSLVALLREARPYMSSNTGPTVVHCSPGTGRTGTAIACDLCMKEFEDSQVTDIMRCVYRLRQDRAGLVQTKEQYTFIYEVLNLYAAKLTGSNMDSL